jgi:hypothetical protein
MKWLFLFTIANFCWNIYLVEFCFYSLFVNQILQYVLFTQIKLRTSCFLVQNPGSDPIPDLDPTTKFWTLDRIRNTVHRKQFLCKPIASKESVMQGVLLLVQLTTNPETWLDINSGWYSHFSQRSFCWTNNKPLQGPFLICYWYTVKRPPSYSHSASLDRRYGRELRHGGLFSGIEAVIRGRTLLRLPQGGRRLA